MNNKKKQKIELSPEDKEYVRKQTKTMIICIIILVVLVAAFFILKAIAMNN